MKIIKYIIVLVTLMVIIGCSFKGNKENGVIGDVGNKIPQHWRDDGIFSSYYSVAYNKLKLMSIDEKIGQILLVRLPATDVEAVINKYKVGGFVFYKKDIDGHDKQSLNKLILSYNNQSKIPLLVAVDEEGGRVVRLSCNKKIRLEAFQSPQNIFEKYGFKGIEDTTKEMCELLGEIGFNINLAPVADISTNPDDFIYSRSFGKSAEETAEFINYVISNSCKSKVSFVIKHFPGYGNNEDTHFGLVVDKRGLEEILQKDMIPFVKGVKAGADSIMVSHNIVAAIDKNNPASLSKQVHEFAREKLGFTGILMTDNIDMEAIRRYTSNTGIVEAVLAGNDIVMISDYKKCTEELRQAIKTGVISEDALDYMVFKVLAWKHYKGML